MSNDYAWSYDSAPVSENTAVVDSCCCNVLQLGKCFALNHSLIAQCEDMRNDTVAACYAIDDVSRQFDCFIGSCGPEEGVVEDVGSSHQHQHDSSPDWIPYYMILVPGIAIYITGYFYLLHVIPKRLLLNYQERESCSSASARDMEEALIRKPQLRGELYNPKDVIIVHALTLIGFCFILLGCLMRWYIETMFSTIVLLFVSWLVEGGARLGMRVARMDHSSSSLSADLPVVEASDIYLAFEEPLQKVLSVFLCQCLLIWIYVQDIFEEGFLDFSKSRTFLWYFFGIFIQLIYLLLKSELESYRYYLDYDLWWLLGYTFSNSTNKNSSTITISTEGVMGGDEASSNELTIGEIRMRIISSLLVNGLGGIILRPLIPIQLAASKSGIEFILNALAAYYIIELDDVAVRKYIISSSTNPKKSRYYSAEDEESAILIEVDADVSVSTDDVSVELQDDGIPIDMYSTDESSEMEN